MKLEQFIFFREIAKHQSISVASEHCYTTPQNVSKTIRALEKELGTVLFQRTRQGIILTPDGQQVLKSTEIITDEIKKLENLYGLNKKSKKSESISSFSILTNAALLKTAMLIFSKFLEDYPPVTVKSSIVQAEPPYLNSTQEFTNFIDDKFRNHNLIFSTLDEYNFDSFRAISKDYAIYSLMQEPLYLEVPSTHPLAEKKSVSLKNILNLPLFAFGVGNNAVPFAYGALERRYNVHLQPALISNGLLSGSTAEEIPFITQYAHLSGKFAWEDDHGTVLIPLQEKCIMHHAMLLPNNEKYNSVYENIVFPIIFKQFPNLYKIV